LLRKNHVREAGFTQGSCHWYIRNKDQTFQVWILIHLSDFLVPEKMVEKIKNPYNYYLPFYCPVWGISQVNLPSENEARRNIRTIRKKGES